MLDSIFFDPIEESLKYIDIGKVYPRFDVVQSFIRPETIINGNKMLVFCSNNYLGLSSSKELMTAAIDAINKYGTGSGGSRILSGNLEIHEILEKKLAEFKGKEDALIFSSGYQANIGIIQALMEVFSINPRLLKKRTRPGVIFSDENNHASIIDGCRLSGAIIEVYKHGDLYDLEKLLSSFPKDRRKLIVTDAVFSMDGDIAPLEGIVRLANQYHAAVLIDDAHGTGIIGKSGHGVTEYFGISEGIDLIMGTFSKAFGAVGGFVAGGKEIIRYLKVASRSFMFSASMPASVAATVLAAIEVINKTPEIIEGLNSKAKYLRTELNSLGFNTLNSKTAIIPLLIGDEKKTIKAAEILFEKGIYALPVQWPAVERGKARIRITLMATHTKEHIDFLLEACRFIKKRLEI